MTERSSELFPEPTFKKEAAIEQTASRGAEVVDDDPAELQDAAHRTETHVRSLGDASLRLCEVHSRLDAASPQEREHTIIDIVKKYKQHPAVQRAALAWRTNTSTTHRGHSDSLTAYFAEAAAYRLLTREDEVELFTAIENGMALYDSLASLDDLSPEETEALISLTAAHQVIFHTNLRLVIDFSKTYWHRTGISVLDLIQTGNEGLSRAISGFKIKKGNKFSTYAAWWIKQTIQRSIANEARAIRLPVGVHEEWLKLMRNVNELTSQLNRTPTDQEIEAAFGITIDEYRNLMNSGRYYLPSLDKPIYDDGDKTLVDFLTTQELLTEQRVEALMASETAKQLISRAALSDHERFVLGLLYGLQPAVIGCPTIVVEGRAVAYQDVFTAMLLETEEPTKAAIGKLMGLTRMKVGAIEKKAFLQLKQVAQGPADDAPRDQ